MKKTKTDLLKAFAKRILLQMLGFCTWKKTLFLLVVVLVWMGGLLLFFP